MPLESNEHEDNATGGGEREAAEEGREAQPQMPPIPPPPNPPPTPAAPEHSDENPSKWRENAKVGFEIFGLVVLTAYTVFSCLQWLQIRWTNRLTREALDKSNYSLTQTLTKMQAQVEAAQTANAETHKLLAATQGATFQLETEISQKNGVYAYVSIRPINVGKTSAINFSGGSVLLRKDRSGRTIQLVRREFSDTTIPNGSAGTLLFTVSNPPGNYMDYRNETFKITTSIAFDNGLGDRRTETVCREMVEISTQLPGFVECGNAQDWEKLAEH